MADEPTTEAGRRLLATVLHSAWEDDERAAILAIEQEAAEQALAGISVMDAAVLRERWPASVARIEQEARADLAVQHERLLRFAEKVATSETDTPGTRAAARYAISGTLDGLFEEMDAAIREVSDERA